MELLREGAKALGLALSSRHLEAFELYFRELAIWNSRFNLTAITSYEGVQTRHFLDSLSCLLALPHGAERTHVPDTMPVLLGSHDLSCLDIGSGAGFPGIPLKILLPEAKMTLIEATRKKVSFLEHMVSVLDLKNTQVLPMRAEDAGRLPAHRERYDLVVCRAVAHLRVLSEYCLPFCRPGGRMIAQKGEDALEEAASASRALSLLGAELTAVKRVKLQDLPSERYLVIIDKVRRTPDAYPRRVGIPSKRPVQ